VAGADIEIGDDAAIQIQGGVAVHQVLDNITAPLL
jgi:hypothetical protein